MNNEYKNVQSAIDTLLNVKSTVRRKKKTEQNKKKEMFVQIINGLEETIIRSSIAYMDFGLDYSKYDESYLAVIDALIYMNFGKEASELISYYLWDRINPDGSTNPILDEDNVEIYLKSPHELWDLMCKLNPKL
tara:strand:- start:386 stop:787 length:402 start_codon:yes stop_codon:yes gene_type:complete